MLNVVAFEENIYSKSVASIENVSQTLLNEPSNSRSFGSDKFSKGFSRLFTSTLLMSDKKLPIPFHASATQICKTYARLPETILQFL